MFEEMAHCIPPRVTATMFAGKWPVMVTTVPTGPVFGLKDVMSKGSITKLVELVPVPFVLVTDTGPVVAPVGTVAEMVVLLMVLKLSVEVPLKLTLETLTKPVPAMIT